MGPFAARWRKSLKWLAGVIALSLWGYAKELSLWLIDNLLGDFAVSWLKEKWAALPDAPYMLARVVGWSAENPVGTALIGAAIVVSVTSVWALIDSRRESPPPEEPPKAPAPVQPQPAPPTPSEIEAAVIHDRLAQSLTRAEAALARPTSSTTTARHALNAAEQQAELHRQYLEQLKPRLELFAIETKSVSVAAVDPRSAYWGNTTLLSIVNRGASVDGVVAHLYYGTALAIPNGLWNDEAYQAVSIGRNVTKDLIVAQKANKSAAHFITFQDGRRNGARYTAYDSAKRIEIRQPQPDCELRVVLTAGAYSKELRFRISTAVGEGVTCAEITP